MFLEFLWGSNWQYFPHDKPGVVWIFIVMKIIPVCFERIIRLVQTSSLPAQLFSDQRARAEDYCNTWPLVLGLELNTSPARCSTVTRFSSQQERSISSVAAFLVLHSDVLTVQCPLSTVQASWWYIWDTTCQCLSHLYPAQYRKRRQISLFHVTNSDGSLS